ncbi:hypothetical protein [Streptomyces longwoodensis]|uniref:hypothetical protein n=1 Tax=Streptomyces longwoodensis TaxID=68231 RepID=UPI00384F4417
MAELGRRQGKPVKKWIPGVHGPAIFVRAGPEDQVRGRGLLRAQADAHLVLLPAVGVPAEHAVRRRLGGAHQRDTGEPGHLKQRLQQLRRVRELPHQLGELIDEHGDGWCLDELEGPGYFLRWDRDNQVPVVSRAFYMDEDEIGATVHRYGREEARVEAREHPAHTPDPDDDPTPPTPPTPPGPGGPGGGRPVLRAVPTFPDGTPIADERHLALWQAVEAAGRDGITIDNLVALGLPEFNARSSVNGPLSQWRAKGWVEHAGKQGRAMAYRLAPRKATVLAGAQASAASEESEARPASL